MTMRARFSARTHSGEAAFFVNLRILPLYLVSSQLLPLERELGFSAAHLGVATALYFGVAAAAATPIGKLIAKLGAQKGLRMGSLLATAASIVAISAQTWWMLLVVTSLGGLANGLMQVATNVFLATDASFRRQGVSFGAKQGAVPLGNALAGAMIPVLGVNLGWRWPFLLAALLAVLALMTAPKLVNTPADETRSVDGPARMKLSSALKWLALAGFCGAAAGNSLALFVVPSAVDVGLLEAGAGAFLAWSAGLVFFFRVAAGWMADRNESSGHREMVGLLGAGALGCVILATTHSVGPYLVAMPLALVGAWGWPGLVFFSVVRIHPESPARASSVILAGNLSGSMLGPIGTGFLADRSLFSGAWVLCSVLAGIGAIAMWLSWRSFESGQSHPREA